MFPITDSENTSEHINMEREHPPTNMAMLGHTVLKLELVQTTTPKHMFTDTKHSTHISYHSSVNFTWRHMMVVIF